MNPTSAQVRNFLSQYFDDAELTVLCFDYFPDVYRDFAQGMPKSQKVQLLLMYCQQHARWADLTAALQRERPNAYETEFATEAPAAQPPVSRHDPNRVFISYAHEDVEFAHRLTDDLRRLGRKIWIAPESIQPGEKWLEAIERGLAESGVFLSLLSARAVGSRWVRSETNIAIELEHKGWLQFIPLLLEPTDIPMMWSAYQYVSFVGGYEAGLHALAARLEGTVVETPAPSPKPKRSETEPSELKPVESKPPDPIVVPPRSRRGLVIGLSAATIAVVLFLVLYLGPELGWWNGDDTRQTPGEVSPPAPPATSDATEFTLAGIETAEPSVTEPHTPEATWTDAPMLMHTPTTAPTSEPSVTPTRLSASNALAVRSTAAPTVAPTAAITAQPPTAPAGPATPTPAPAGLPVSVFVDWFNFGQANAYTDIFAVYADGTEVNVTNNTARENSAVLSPDHTLIAFEQGAPTQIYYMNIDGTGVNQVTFGPQTNRNPVWSSDGTEIYFDSWESGQRLAYSLATGEVRPLP